VDLRTVMETLGHSQISLTMNTYAHVLPALQRVAWTRRLEPLTATTVRRISRSKQSFSRLIDSFPFQPHLVPL
jgi:hypothetical protein